MKKLIGPIVMLLAGVLGVTLVTASYLSTTPITIKTLRIDDVDPAVNEIAGYLSPNPGGVGPMTRAMLLSNVVTAASY